jgi:hypothetical protein
VVSARRDHVTDMDRAYRWLRENKVQHASPGPQRLPNGIQAFYFRDPDGHTLEILKFPRDKGGDKLFLGIDHTAIVIRTRMRAYGFIATYSACKSPAKAKITDRTGAAQ